MHYPSIYMKEKYLLILKALINWLNSIYAKATQTPEENISAYNSLSPIATADSENLYTKALKWALKTRKENDIKNIALTGPYGSGKSSVLKTFRENYKGEDLHFLNISLATFKEENPNKSELTKGEDLIRLIELSILQQIFYYEEDHKIPDSRLKKIKNYKKKNLLIESFGLLFLILAIVNLANPDLLKVLTNIESFKVFGLIYYLSLFISILGLFFLIYKSIRVLYRIRINKLSFNNTEIELGGDLDKSILNHHIDEIIYFFEVRPYNVVIIEDLDRFEQTEIFTKLREINLLINNSQKVKKEVVFIYAVRDDIFKDKERTKFFDFIIPIIPVINSSNSKEILLGKKTTNQYNLSDDLIEDISLFIDDMRLLHNITNEFYVYYQHLNPSLNQDKLLSILVYKNIFPTDFTKLSENEGELYSTLSNKKFYVSKEISKIEESISSLKEDIEDLEKLKIKDIKELRRLYILEYITRLEWFKSFQISYEEKKIESLFEDDIFDYFIKNNVSYNRFNKYYNTGQYTENNTKINIKFEEIEKYVDPDSNYLERKKSIDDWNKNKVETLKNKVQELEKEKSKVRNLKIKDLASKGHINFKSLNEKQNLLISVLLRNGYIAEDYLDYISIFYEGSISKIDNQFLLNVKSQTSTDYNYKLNKIDKLIERINPPEFENVFILNFSMLDYILQNPNLKSKQELIINQLTNESETSIKFINEFIENSPNTKEFISVLCSAWPGIWKYIDSQSNFPEKKKDEYLKLIIDFSDLADIKKVAANSTFAQYISNKKDFSNLAQSQDKLKLILKELDIKITDISNEDTNEEMFDYIYEHNHYSITTKNILYIIKAKGSYNQGDFDTRNFFAVSNSNCIPMIQYIGLNIRKYIDDLYLKIETNNNEQEDYLLQLLNNGFLINDQIFKIITKVQTKIKDITLVSKPDVVYVLFEESKVWPTWNNVFNYYTNNENELNDTLVLFLNNIENSTELSKAKIPKDAEGENKYSTFIISLIKTEELSNYVYDLILKSIPYTYKSIHFEALTEEKVELLIKNNILSFNTENYNLLKDNFNNLHIRFIESKKLQFITSIIDFELNTNDLLSLLKSTILSSEEKNVVIETVDESLINSNNSSLKEIGELILRNSGFRISKSLLNLILVNPQISAIQKVKIFNLKNNLFENQDITNFLNTLPEPYFDIAIKGKRPSIDNNDINKRLVEILGAKGYISKFTIETKKIKVYTYINK